MPYPKKVWKERLAERSDLTCYLTHLTRCCATGDLNTALKVLVKILRERKLVGSTPQSGFLHGERTAVCFQDAPLHSAVQNLWFEQKQRATKGWKLRYEPCGLLFPKEYVFRKGGRPVIYDKPEDAKAYLPASEWWRIVRLDLSDDNSFVDWTHEREWRVAGDFEFDLQSAHILLTNQHIYQHFLEECRKISDVDILGSIAGIVTLSPVLH